MENDRPQNRSLSPRSEDSIRSFRLARSPWARFVLTLILGLVATVHSGIAQPAEAAREPTLELVVGPDFRWVKPDLLLVSFELRNIGTKSVVVAQRPGFFLGMSCSTEDGGGRGSVPGGVACGMGSRGSFLELGPEDALLGEKVVDIPEDCVRDITVWGEYQTLTANAWDLPARKARINSEPFLIGKR
jgi:hypothetical protein